MALQKNQGRTHYVCCPPYLCTQKLKIEGKDMKQVKYDKVYEITDSLQRV